jgi:predicted enzyme related to lactoylglutathione lyase
MEQGKKGAVKNWVSIPEPKYLGKWGRRKKSPPAVHAAARAVNIGNQGDETMPHRIDQCAIPVKDLDRAIRFYSAVLGFPVKKVQFHNKTIGLLSFGEGEFIGCLYRTDLKFPATKRPRVYLDVHGRLDKAIEAIGPNGGRVVETCHPIGASGLGAVIEDSEGNRIALHSA